MSELARQVVEALRASGARLTGSYARGEETEASDFDFYVPERNWKKFKALAPPGWESVFIGCLGWHTPDGLIDVSFIFRNQRKKRLPSGRREVLGVNWALW